MLIHFFWKNFFASLAILPVFIYMRGAKSMSRKKKELKIHNIAKIYLHTLLLSADEIHSLQSQNLYSFLSAVELAYSSLSAPLQKIINNDFFYQDYPGWWRLLYKKSNYQRLKNQAINQFLEVFYEI